MNKLKSLILILCFTIISCDKKNPEKTYESDKITIIYKENNSIFSEKSISLQFGLKDTILKSKNFSFIEINDLFIKSLGKTKKEINYLETGKYDLLIIKKDTLLNNDNIYKEFERFLITEKLIKID
ncbi:hypothetical protein ACFO3U_05085 [Flavobacterium ponti]|uniref:Uncharacterized protein n=1 Tax=Flavobacterium ponti TaxID=665133 RepID=A0ABV9P3Z8_9FLAO